MHGRENKFEFSPFQNFIVEKNVNVVLSIQKIQIGSNEICQKNKYLKI